MQTRKSTASIGRSRGSREAAANQVLWRRIVDREKYIFPGTVLAAKLGFQDFKTENNA